MEVKLKGVEAPDLKTRRYLPPRSCGMAPAMGVGVGAKEDAIFHWRDYCDVHNLFYGASFRLPNNSA